LFAGGCTPQRRAEPPKPDPTSEPWYAQTVETVVALQREGEARVKERKMDAAAAKITEAQPLAARLLSVSKPTLEAVQAASDLDDLYGRMLMRNRHYGWARMQFQKNVARWKNWKPRTEETERRLAQAEAAIAECDRQLARGR
jgi:hypothetical protein